MSFYYREPPLDPPCEEPEPTVYCPECEEEAQINKYFQIECISCDECFDMPEPDFDYDDYEDRGYAYGY